MMFKDTPEGTTHFYGDSCKPPHRCPEGTCQRAYNNVCKVCNLDMPKSTPDLRPTPNVGEWEKEFDKEFKESFEGGDMYMWERAQPIKSFIRSLISQTRLSTIEELKDEAMREYGRGQNEGRQIAIEEAKGCVPEEKELLVVTDTSLAVKSACDTLRSKMLDNLNKLK